MSNANPIQSAHQEPRVASPRTPAAPELRIAQPGPARRPVAGSGTETATSADAFLRRRRRALQRLLLGSITSVVLVAVLGITALWVSRGTTRVAQSPEGSGPSGGHSAAAPAYAPDDPQDPENTPDPEPLATSPGGAAPPPAELPPGSPGETPPPSSATVPAPGASPASSQPAAFAQPAAATQFPGAASGTAAGKPSTANADPPNVGTPPPAQPQPAPAGSVLPGSIPPASAARPDGAKGAGSGTESRDPPQKRAEGPVVELTPAVDLAPVGSVTDASAPPQVLGRIHLDAGEPCYLTLLGGERAVKGRTTFQLRSAQHGTAPRDWEFVLQDPVDGEVVIGTMSLANSELQFAWTAEGGRHAAASHLRNCAVQVSAGTEKPHVFALRTVHRGPAIALGPLEKSPVVVKLNLASLPDSAALRMEAALVGHKFLFESVGNTDITRAAQWVYLGESKEHAVLSLKLETAVTPKALQVELTPFVHLGGPAQRLTPALRRKLSVAELQRQRESWLVRSEQLKRNAPKQASPAYDAELQKMGGAIESLDHSIRQLRQLEEILGRLRSLALQLSVSYDAGNTKVELVDLRGPGES